MIKYKRRFAKKIIPVTSFFMLKLRGFLLLQYTFICIFILKNVK